MKPALQRLLLALWYPTLGVVGICIVVGVAAASGHNYRVATLLSALAIIGIGAASRISLAIEPNHVKWCNGLRQRTLAWDDIESIAVEPSFPSPASLPAIYLFPRKGGFEELRASQFMVGADRRADLAERFRRLGHAAGVSVTLPEKPSIGWRESVRR